MSDSQKPDRRLQSAEGPRQQAATRCETHRPADSTRSIQLFWHGSNGNVFCWFAQGQPDDWGTGQFGHGADEPDRDAVNITTFLVNYARNQYPEMLGGLTFKKSDYKYRPDK